MQSTRRLHFLLNHRLLFVTTISILFILILLVIPTSYAAKTVYGDQVSIGDGQVQSYIEYSDNGIPKAVGIEFNESTLKNLPHGTDAINCWDKNKDGNIDIEGHECLHTHERAIFLPKHSKDIPFNWVLLNWNSGGHPPPGVYDLPHFDIHFYMMDYVKRNRIRMGDCGLEMINCDDMKKALMPLPEEYLPKGYISVGEDVAVPRMGMHLLDPTSPELLEPPKKKAFTHTFIFGTYEGRLIFFEPMVTYGFLQSKPDICSPINQPTKYEQSGYYPTKYCIRLNAASSNYTVSLEDMVKH